MELVKQGSVQRTINVRLALTTLSAIGVIVPLGFLWHRHQQQKTAGAYLQRADQYEKEGQVQRAIHHLNQYLSLKPDDIEARARLVALFSQGIATPQQRKRAIGMLYPVVGALPDRHDLRLQLAEQLLIAGEFAAAEVEANKFLTGSPANLEAGRAHRVVALSRLARARHRDAGFVRKTVQAFEAAIASVPSDIDLAIGAAMLYRDYTDLLEDSNQSLAQRADQIVEKMVEAREFDVVALLARGHYRKKYGLPLDLAQLDDAVDSDEGPVEASLFLAAEYENLQTPESLEKAEIVLRDAIDRMPSDTRAYAALARLRAAAGHLDEAKDLLQRAMQAAGDQDASLVLASATISIELGLLDDAQRQLDEAGALLRDQGRTLPPEQQSWLERELQLVQASLLLSQDRPSEAAKLLAPLADSGIKRTALHVRPDYRATMLLAHVASDQGAWDLAAEHWLSYCKRHPGDAVAHRMAGRALLNSGHVEVAIETLEEARDLGASAGAAVDLALAHLAAQLALPLAERNWSAFRAAIDAAKEQGTASGDAGRLVIAQFEYLRALAASGWRDSARRLLEEARPMLLNDPDLRRNLPLLYLAVDAKDAAAEGLKDVIGLEVSESRKALIRSAYFAQLGNYEAADAELAQGIEAATFPHERRQLLLERVRRAAECGNVDSAYDLAKELVAAAPNDVPSLCMAIEVATAGGEKETAWKWEDHLRRVEGEAGTNWKSFRAARMLDGYKELRDEEKQALDKLIAELRELRPQWYRPFVLIGRQQELVGEKRLAAISYRRALQLGDRQLATVLRLVSLLTQMGNLKDAEQLVLWLRDGHDRLGQAQGANRISPLSALQLHAQLLLRQGKAEEVTERIDQFIKRQHVPSDESDREKFYAQIASLYTSLNLHSAAEPWLRNLCKLTPEAFAPLARNLLSQGRVDDALALCLDHFEGDLAPLAARSAAEILASQRGTRAANVSQVHEMITSAVDEFDQNVPLLHSVAVYLIGRGETDEATRLLRRVVALQPDHSLAINNLGTLLGEREDSREEARELIEQAIQSFGRAPALLDTLGTIYLRAGDLDRAQKCLEEAVAHGQADPRYRFHLAAAIYKLGRTSEAGELFQVALQGGLAQRFLTQPDKDLLLELQSALSIPDKERQSDDSIRGWSPSRLETIPGT